MNDPIRHYFEKHGFQLSDIQEIVCGKRYSAVLLQNGNIGVCANMLNKIHANIEDLHHPDLNKIEHRILINAYLNSKLNYGNCYENTIDIWEGIDYTKYKNIVMIGLFKPILKLFNQNNIKIHVFDLVKQNKNLTSSKKKLLHIKRADGIILSATSMFNGTFMEIINNTSDECDIFILGPSSIMDGDMFQYNNIRGIFGAVFNPHDNRVLDVIRCGMGTQKFIQFGRKVSLIDNYTGG
jgi:uncharacterized protein (DUF4213/DUF364 family)